MRLFAHAVLALAITVVAAACSAPADDAATSPGSSTDSPTIPTQTGESGDAPSTEEPVHPSDLTPLTPKPTSPLEGQLPGALPTGPVPKDVVNRTDVREAVEAEAGRRGVDISAVSIAGFADVTWRDGSLGCPQPGKMYTMALVPGHQLILEVGGELASYHAAKDKPFRYCADPQPATPREDG